MNTLELLIAGRAKIAKRKNWCQHLLSKGDAVCSVGALYRYGFNDLVSDIIVVEAYEALQHIIDLKSLGHLSVADFNDSHTHAEVLAVWDKAIVVERDKQTQLAVEAIKADALKGAEDALKQGSDPSRAAEAVTG